MGARVGGDWSDPSGAEVISQSARESRWLRELLRRCEAQRHDGTCRRLCFSDLHCPKIHCDCDDAADLDGGILAGQYATVR